MVARILCLTALAAALAVPALASPQDARQGGWAWPGDLRAMLDRLRAREARDGGAPRTGNGNGNGNVGSGNGNGNSGSGNGNLNIGDGRGNGFASDGNGNGQGR